MSDFDWSKYEQLRDRGVSDHDVYRQAVADGVRPFPDCIRMLRDVFGVDLYRAKEIHLQADGIANSLDEYQSSLVPVIEEAVREMEAEERDLDGIC